MNNLICNGATNSSQGLWQSYQELSGLAQTGALNVILFFTDGRPTAVTENFPIKNSSTCTPSGNAGPKLGVITLGGTTTMGLTLGRPRTTSGLGLDGDVRQQRLQLFGEWKPGQGNYGFIVRSARR